MHSVPGFLAGALSREMDCIRIEVIKDAESMVEVIHQQKYGIHLVPAQNVVHDWL